MAIWNNITGTNNTVGYGFSTNPGITIKQVDMSNFIDNNQQKRYAGGRSEKSDSGSKLPDEIRTGVKGQYVNAMNMIDSTLKSLENSQYEAMKSALDKGATPEELKQMENNYISQTNQLNSMKMMYNVALTNESLQYKANRKAYTDFQDANILGEYSVAPDATDLTDETDMFYGNVFKLTKGNNGGYQIQTYQDALNEDDQTSFINKDMNPTAAYIPHKMNNGETVSKNIKDYVIESGKIEYIEGLTDQKMVNWMLNKNAQTVTTDSENINAIVNNIWEKLSSDDRYYIMNRTLKNGITRYTGKDNKGKDQYEFVPGNKMLNDININQVKYEEYRKKYEEALSQNDNKKAEEYKQQAEEYQRSGEKLSKELMTFAKGNAIAIAKGKSIGLYNMSMTTDPKAVGENGYNDDDSSEFMRVIATGLSSDENLYFEYADDKTGQNEAMNRNLKNIRGQDMAKSFILSTEAKNIVARRTFGVERNDLLEKENIPLSKMGAFFIMNGVYSNKSALGDEKILDKIIIKGIGNTGKFLPKFYNPEDGQTYSKEIQRNAKGQVIGQPYVDVVLSTEDGNVKLPMIAPDQKTIVYRTIKEIYGLDKKSTNYNIEKDDKGNYVFHVYQEAPNPYYGNKDIRQVGTMMAWAEAQDAEAGRNADNQRDEYFNKLRWDNLMKDEKGNTLEGSFAYGERYIGSPKDIYNKIKTKSFQFYPSDASSRKRYLYQMIDNLEENHIDKTKGAKLKNDILFLMKVENQQSDDVWVAPVN